MKTAIAAALFLLGEVALAGTPPLVGNETVTDVEWKRLQAGETVVRTAKAVGAPGGEAVIGFIIVKDGWERVFDEVADRERRPGYSVCLKSFVVLSREVSGGVEVVKGRETHEALGMKRRYTVDYEDDRAQKQIRWALDQSAQNDVAQLVGSWRFFPLEADKTLLVARFAGTGGGLPAFLQELMARINLGKTLEETKARVEAKKGDRR